MWGSIANLAEKEVGYHCKPYRKGRWGTIANLAFQTFQVVRFAVVPHLPFLQGSQCNVYNGNPPSFPVKYLMQGLQWYPPSFPVRCVMQDLQCMVCNAMFAMQSLQLYPTFLSSKVCNAMFAMVPTFLSCMVCIHPP